MVAITVDLLWGYTGILTFGQAAFFGIGAYAAGLVFTHIGFSPGHGGAGTRGGVGCEHGGRGAGGVLSFYPGATPLYASVVSLVLPIVATQLHLLRRHLHRVEQRPVGLRELRPRDEHLAVAGRRPAAGDLTLAALRFVRSDAGRLLVAIRENEARCDYLGLNTSRMKTLLLVGLSAGRARGGLPLRLLRHGGGAGDGGLPVRHRDASSGWRSAAAAR